MFQRIDNYYTQDIRIDLVPASVLAGLNPDHAVYRAAAERGAFVVSVLQGDVHDSVYAPRLEQIVDTLAEARMLFDRLVFENPDAAGFDFVAHPSAKMANPAAAAKAP